MKRGTMDIQRAAGLVASLLPVCLLCSCMIFATGDPSYVGEAPDSMKREAEHVPPVYDLHPYGAVSKARIGEWATYRVDDRTITLAAVAKEGANVWVEVIDEGAPRTVSARLVTPAGRVVKAFHRRLPDGPVTAQKLGQAPLEGDDGFAEVDREETDEEFRVGEQALPAKHVRIVLEDLDGRQRVNEAWWSPRVPGLYAGSEHGGLLRRGAATLLRFGTDARPTLTPPK
ncbi:MAG: hypothetical protein ACYTAF_07100 [Planctomycetota bacterium]|jgi:hypothetical protein